MRFANTEASALNASAASRNVLAWRRFIRLSKLQAPSSKLQRNSKHQAPNICRSSIEVWNLKFLWMLAVGCWSFSYLLNLSSAEQSRRLDEQDQNQNGEGDGVAVGRGNVAGDERFR